MIIETERPGSVRADAIVRAYLTEVASRWYGRVATSAEVDRALHEEPYDDLQEDSGVFVVANDGEAAVACVGVRFVGHVGELTKVFTLPEHRGRGVGSALLRHVEAVCRVRGITSLRLDTRAELAEACALYERLGFMRVPPFNDDPYSDRWYAKPLS
ncbi:GNAT family N-acetyltransferase [Curtobacterium aurantiacum]|uniref:GNAT family N-acetyltransferase n=1 Tax=Curtobacterium aurantiacum TaxID=3236919 RepID=A0ABS5VE05_9MICO|nr:GNAT family N-acetyltransferase [Curtobacterium flaccumfaciens]MBT1544386.1 GNAT family N-acetyltransferase [Curtobacterium flaccumfaciens pv. flaccumfaciens]MBT1587214.1 GNAT family N-acetyltransferase [Curtobacterium flaccumfaciens pv. flaccumfaciens]